MDSNQYDFVAIGDITTDAFIQVSDVRIDTDPDLAYDGGAKEICFRFGDKIEYDDAAIVAAVGNSPNAAVSATRLGLKAALVTNLGDDRNGEDCLEALKERGVDTEFVKVHPGSKSNYHYVLRFGAERTILVKHYEYEYALPEFATPPRWLYLSSLGENSLAFHQEITEYLKAHPETKLAFQPGTFQMKLGYETLKELYQESDLFFCNKEEAERILDTTSDDVKTLLKDMHEHGPALVVITDGPNGAFAFDGTEYWQMPMYPDPKPPTDRTGAGDSFSSTFTSAIALGKDVPTALSWGPINSMSVVQYIGAQAGLLTEAKLLEYLESAPDTYKPEKF